ncbi:hypothetical protein QTP88_009771 [Uroleucon formosanum]
MTSFGAKNIATEGFMSTFKVQGQVYHLVGSLMHKPDQRAQFLQIYFVGKDERELRLRCANFPDVKPGLVTQLQSMLHEKNSYVKQFKTTINAVQKNCKEFKVVIRADRKPTNAHIGRFNTPTQNEITLIIVSQLFENRDIVLQSHDNKLQRISEIHRAYEALQYPLMFCHDEDGYSIDIPLCNAITKLLLEKKVSAASFYAYQIMIRQDEVNHIVYFRSLVGQFLVDMYAKIETERLNFIRNHQKQLKAENYIHLKNAVGRNDFNATDIGQVVGTEIEYKCIDMALKTDNAVHYPVEFLNALNPPGFPVHKLVLKVVLKENQRIPLLSSNYPFEFKRLQFPIKVSFAMNINKSQGQLLKIAGIDLSDDCFTYGQFYVACSRVSSPTSLVILAPNGRTTNVVYKEEL